MQNTSGEMIAFVRTVQLGSFSSAAREFGLTPSALSKLVTRLEVRLGVRLLNRTTRKISLTPEGSAYFNRCQSILADIEEAEAELAHFRGRPRGLLRLSVGTAFGMHQLVPALPRFVERYPEIELDLLVSDRRIDLVYEGLGMAILIGALPDSALVGRQICELDRTICAAPSYLERHGMPAHPQDLTKHNCLYVSSMPELRFWPFETPDGPQIIKISGTIGSDSAETLVRLAVQGLGIVRLVDVLVADEIAQGKLVPILTAFHYVDPAPITAVYPPGRHRSPKVAAMMDFLVENFSHMPWRPNRESVAVAKPA